MLSTKVHEIVSNHLDTAKDPLLIVLTSHTAKLSMCCIVATKLLNRGSFCGTILLISLLAQPAAPKPTIWVVSGMERVGQKDPPQKRHRVELLAARGEYEPFQIVVRATVQRLTNVNLTLSDLRGPHGAVIGKENLIAYREHYVHVEHGSPQRTSATQPPLGPGWYADALVPFLDPATGKPPGSAKIRAVHFGCGTGQESTAMDRRIRPPKRSARQISRLLHGDKRSGRSDWRI